MDDGDWLADMLDELYGFAAQQRDTTMMNSLDRIRDIYERELSETRASRRKVPSVH